MCISKVCSRRRCIIIKKSIYRRKLLLKNLNFNNMIILLVLFCIARLHSYDKIVASILPKVLIRIIIGVTHADSFIKVSSITNFTSRYWLCNSLISYNKKKLQFVTCYTIKMFSNLLLIHLPFAILTSSTTDDLYFLHQ